jgi:hypothetical protein
MFSVLVIKTVQMKWILSIYLTLISLTGFSQTQNILGLLASTFFGGDGGDYVNCMTVDDNGNVYLAGFSYSSDFPITPNAYDSNGVMYICKFDPLLENLLASTRIGGTASAEPEEITFFNNELIVIGHTTSSVFPVTSGAYDTTYNSSYDAFILKMDPNLETLIASTFYGSSGSDAAWASAIDSSGNIFISGPTYSSNLPVTTGAWDENYHGNTDGYIAKFSNDLSTLLAATYLGGAEYDRIDEMTIDQSGNIIIAGSTESLDYPVSLNAPYSNAIGGANDLVITKLDNNLTTIISSTYFGGNNVEKVTSLKIDELGNVFVAGITFSDTFIVKAAIDSTYNGNSDIFIAKFTNNVDTLLSSTYFGGSDEDGYYINPDQGQVVINISDLNEVYLIAFTKSLDYPGNPYLLDTNNGGWGDIGISVFDNTLSTIISSTVYGGTSGDKISSFQFDQISNFYITGSTLSSDYPISPFAYNSVFVGNFSDAFVTKFDAALVSKVNEFSWVKEKDTRIFPVPSSDKVFFESEEAIVETRLYSITGQLISYYESLNENYISISELDPGIYILQLISFSNQVNKKIIKN